MFTTSVLSGMSTLDLILTTLYCCASDATAGFTRELTPSETISLTLTLRDGWTRYGRKPDGTVVEISDSRRYRMVGNGVVSAVVRQIVECIERAA
jgi:site-specific DNA-cytosine methylase